MVTKQMDVSNAFLDGTLDEEIYMRQPEGYLNKHSPHSVCRLRKSLYGCKQAQRVWNESFNNTMELIGFRRCMYDQCVYVRGKGGDLTFVALWVDDIVGFSKSDKSLQNLFHELNKAYTVRDLGKLHECLSLNFNDDKNSGAWKVDQTHYVHKLLQKFSMAESKPCNTPATTALLDDTMCPNTPAEKSRNGNSPL